MNLSFSEENEVKIENKTDQSENVDNHANTTRNSNAKPIFTKVQHRLPPKRNPIAPIINSPIITHKKENANKKIPQIRNVNQHDQNLFGTAEGNNADTNFEVRHGYAGINEFSENIQNNPNEEETNNTNSNINTSLTSSELNKKLDKLKNEIKELKQSKSAIEISYQLEGNKVRAYEKEIEELRRQINVYRVKEVKEGEHTLKLEVQNLNNKLEFRRRENDLLRKENESLAKENKRLQEYLQSYQNKESRINDLPKTDEKIDERHSQRVENRGDFNDEDKNNEEDLQLKESRLDSNKNVVHSHHHFDHLEANKSENIVELDEETEVFPVITNSPPKQTSESIFNQEEETVEDVFSHKPNNINAPKIQSKPPTFTNPLPSKASQPSPKLPPQSKEKLTPQMAKKSNLFENPEDDENVNDVFSTTKSSPTKHNTTVKSSIVAKSPQLNPQNPSRTIQTIENKNKTSVKSPFSMNDEDDVEDLFKKSATGAKSIFDF